MIAFIFSFSNCNFNFCIVQFTSNRLERKNNIIKNSNNYLVLVRYKTKRQKVFSPVLLFLGQNQGHRTNLLHRGQSNEFDSTYLQKDD